MTSSGSHQSKGGYPPAPDRFIRGNEAPAVEISSKLRHEASLTEGQSIRVAAESAMPVEESIEIGVPAGYKVVAEVTALNSQVLDALAEAGVEKGEYADKVATRYYVIMQENDFFGAEAGSPAFHVLNQQSLDQLATDNSSDVVGNHSTDSLLPSYRGMGPGYSEFVYGRVSAATDNRLKGKSSVPRDVNGFGDGVINYGAEAEQAISRAHFSIAYDEAASQGGVKIESLSTYEGGYTRVRTFEQPTIKYTDKDLEAASISPVVHPFYKERDREGADGLLPATPHESALEKVSSGGVEVLATDNRLQIEAWFSSRFQSLANRLRFEGNMLRQGKKSRNLYAAALGVLLSAGFFLDQAEKMSGAGESPARIITAGLVSGVLGATGSKMAWDSGKMHLQEQDDARKRGLLPEGY